jgi:hypothetical protein
MHKGNIFILYFKYLNNLMYILIIYYFIFSLFNTLEFFKIRNKPIAPSVLNQLVQLEAQLQSGVTNPPLSNEIMNKFTAFNIDSSTYLSRFQEAYQLALKKFKKHIDQHPTLLLFKAIQCFDPQYLHSQQARQDINLYKCIPEFENPSNTIIYEWGIYCKLDETFDYDNNFDLDAYWKEKIRYLPNLSQIALVYIWLPVSGVDVERSFSVYKNILTDRRQALSENSISILNFLYFNN